MIKVDNLVKYYDDFLAVNKVSFSIDKGEIVGLLGPNGAGKSTTIRMICGYLSPNQGTIEIDGMDINEKPIEVKKLIGYLPESAPLYDHMIVFDYLSYIADLRNIPKKKIIQRLQEVTELCGLNQVMHKNVGQLSKGYRQRVGLAHVLIADPDILVLDEPTSGLDPNQIVEIRKLIKEIGKTKTIILCSHILSEVEATCNRVIIINKGAIALDSSVKDLKDSNKGKKIFLEVEMKGVEENNLISELSAIEGVKVAQKEKQISEHSILFSISYDQSKDLRVNIFDFIIKKKLRLLEFYQEVKSLENIFRELTSRISDQGNHSNIDLKKVGLAEVSKTDENLKNKV